MAERPLTYTEWAHQRGFWSEGEAEAYREGARRAIYEMINNSSNPFSTLAAIQVKSRLAPTEGIEAWKSETG